MDRLNFNRKRGPKPGTLRKVPYFPERVMKVYKLRSSGLTLREVGDVLNMTPAGVSHVMERWGSWAAENMK